MLEEQSNAVPSNTQQPLPTFENILAFPRQFADEPWPEYVGRVQLWDRERIEKAQASGAYRAVPYVPGLDPVCRGLFVSLAWHSFSEGLGQYAPIRLSERCLAALMGDTSSYAKGRASTAMHHLIEAGAVEVLEKAKGSRPRLIRVSQCQKRPSKEPNNDFKKGTKPGGPIKKEDKGRTSTAQSGTKSRSQRTDELARAVHNRFAGDISRSDALDLISQHGEDVVSRQLKWFGYRDIERFRKGAAAAFRCFCRDNDEEPETVRNGRLAMEAMERRRLEEEQRQRRERQRADRLEAYRLETLKIAHETMTAEEIKEIEREARDEIIRRLGEGALSWALETEISNAFERRLGRVRSSAEI